MITDKHFIDWEASVFGYGYGSGEPHTIPALWELFSLIKTETHAGNVVRSYWYEDLEREMPPAVVWLLLNILHHDGVFEYGTSPRGSWLTEHGTLLHEYITSKASPEELLAAIDVDCETYRHCYPSHCNCDGEMCLNPLFPDGHRRA